MRKLSTAVFGACAMNWALGCAFALSLLVAPASAQTTAAGPYYAIPSWDQQLPAAQRFIVLSNWVDANFPSGGAAVLDRETGLIWERAPSAERSFSFSGAQFHCNGLRTGNRMGWRVPTLQELTSLMDPTIPLPGPTLPAGHPFVNVQQFAYWSATKNPANPASTDAAWVGSFAFGTASPLGTDATLSSWCVRGGQGTDAQ